MPTTELNPKVQEMLDKQEIHEVLMRYCRGIDRCDEELVRSAYHPDAMDEHGEFNGKVEDFIAWVIPALRENCRMTMHSICNELVEVRGDKAYCESYVVAYHRMERNGAEVDFTLGGRYVDRFERRHGTWKIAHRKLMLDWDRVDPVDAKHPTRHLYTMGVRTREDWVYHR